MNVSREEFRAGLEREKRRRTGAKRTAPKEYEPDPVAEYCRERRTAYLMSVKRRMYNC